MVVRGMGAVALAAGLLAGCGQGLQVQRVAPGLTAQAKAARVVISEIEVATAWRDLQAANGPLTLIDVREAEEFAAGHAPGAKLFPLSKIEQWGPGLEMRKMNYLVICRSGRRSMAACQRMVELGYAHVTNVKGGMIAWEQQGLPTER